MKKLAADGGEDAELLLAVLSLFKADLPCYRYTGDVRHNTDDRVELQTFLSVFHVEVKFIDLAIDAQRDITDRAFEDCVTIIQTLLDLFESLLNQQTVCSLPNALHSREPRIKIARFKVKVKVEAFFLMFSKSTSKAIKDSQSRHAKLKALHQYMKNTIDNHVNSHVDLGLLVQLSSREEDCIKVLGILTECSKALYLIFPSKTQVSHIDSSSRADKIVGPNWKIRSLANGLHTALKVQWPNCENARHEAKLQLATHQCSKYINRRVNFDVLLTTHSMPSRWQEGRFLVTEAGVSVLPKYEKSAPISMGDICTLITKSQEGQYRLQVLMEDEKLWRIPPVKNKFTELDAEPTTSLRALLQEGHFTRETFKLKDKRILGIVLAHSFVQLCEGPWLNEEWNKDNIFFLYSPSRKKLLDIHRPYVAASFKGNPTGRGASDFQSMHHYPSILALGLLLLEIEIGKPIELASEDCDPTTGLPNDLTAWNTLKRLLEDPDVHDEIRQDFKSVIESCLEPQGFLPRDMTFEDLIFREKLYDRIVFPLENELSKGWPDVSLDSLSELLNARSLISPSPLAHFPALANAQPQANQDFSAKHSVSICSTDSSAGTPSVSIHTSQEPRNQERFSLFDHETDHDENILKRARTFFELLRTFQNEHIRPLDKDHKRSKGRIRIAILDTGIDGTNSLIRAHWKRIKGIRSWVGPTVENTYPPDHCSASLLQKFGGDDCGHGTHVTALLLTVAPNAEIFMARIARNQTISEVDHIADAIKWATDKWEVDIITMSFGVPVHKISENITSAITYAHSKNKILFAAASNDGGNGRIAYPATDFRVICINSTDGLGNKSGFNPSDKGSGDNFATLGAGVESLWKSEKVYISGTSYATPVAAGLAAMVLEYATCKLEMTTVQRGWLHSSDGMRTVMRLMVEKRDGYDYVAPWTFWEPGTSEAYICETILKKLISRR